MANRERGEIDVDVKGKAYTLTLPINAICELEDKLSTPSQEVSFSDFLARLSRRRMTDVRLFFWAALRTHHPDMTVVQAGDLIQHMGGLGKVAETMGRLSESATADPADVDAAGVDQQKSGETPTAARPH